MPVILAEISPFDNSVPLLLGAVLRKKQALFWLLAVLILPSLLGWRIYGEIQHARLERPLITAIRNGDVKKTQGLLFCGADPNSVDRPLRPRMSIISLVKASIQGKPVQPAATPYPYALNLALTVETRNPAIARMLIEAGADGVDAACVRILLAAGANIHAKDIHGRTPLKYAAGMVTDIASHSEDDRYDRRNMRHPGNPKSERLLSS